MKHLRFFIVCTPESFQTRLGKIPFLHTIPSQPSQQFRKSKHHDKCNIRENTLLINCLAQSLFPNLFFHKDKSSYSFHNSTTGLSVGDNCLDVATSMEPIDC